MLKKHPDEYKVDLDWFVDHMADKLYANQYKGGWEHDSVMSLLCSLEKELIELRAAINTKDRHQYMEVVQECADVANFAFMIADVILPKQQKTEHGIPPTAKAAGILPTTT